MLRGLFVTGTDTGVGKTVVAAALLIRYRRPGQVVYWKPIQTGIEVDDDTATVRRLTLCQANECFDHGARLKRPVSPHLAAQLAGIRISVSEIAALTAQREAQRWIVEGAGGALVPLNESDMVADLAVQLGLPAIVVSRTTLGTINHTLLTLEALRHRGIHVAGLVFVGDPNADNRKAIERFGAVVTLGEMPHFAVLTPEILADWATTRLDLSGMLSSYLSSP